MRVACLILGYNGAPVLRSALSVYLALGWDVFVHVDRKADIATYCQALGGRERSCRFIGERLPVFWGGFSMMKAEFALIDAALSAGNYDRFLLLSDDAFPLASLACLERMLAEDVDRITVGRQRADSGFHRRYYGFYYFDHGATNPRGGNEREIDEALVRKIGEAWNLMALGKKTIDVYFGSQFWVLQRHTVDQVLSICRSDTHLRKSFEFSALSDELMIQSVYGNFLRDRLYTGGPVFADFSRGLGPLTYSSFDQLPEDLPCHVAFVRKLDPSAQQFLGELEEHVVTQGWRGVSAGASTCSVALIATAHAARGRVDLALGKPAIQSSVSPWSHHPTVELDAAGGNSEMIHDDYGFCTAEEGSPWWQVDLLGSFAIAEIQITNRRTSPERLRRFQLCGSLDGTHWTRLYSKSDDTVFGQHDDESLVIRLPTNPPVARYVRLTLHGSGFLHFRSLKIFGDPRDT